MGTDTAVKLELGEEAGEPAKAATRKKEKGDQKLMVCQALALESDVGRRTKLGGQLHASWERYAKYMDPERNLSHDDDEGDDDIPKFKSDEDRAPSKQKLRSTVWRDGGKWYIRSAKCNSIPES